MSEPKSIYETRAQYEARIANEAVADVPAVATSGVDGAVASMPVSKTEDAGSSPAQPATPDTEE